MASKKGKNKWLDFVVEHQVILLIMVTLIAYTVLRLHASSLPITDDWAQQNVEAYYTASGKESLIGTQQFEDDVKKSSEQYKDIYRDKYGNTYLYGVDPYKFLGQARDIFDGKSADFLLPYLEAYFYKLLAIFSSNITLIQAAFWLPFVVTLFSIILIFFIARKLTNDLGGFFAAFILAIHPQFFTATQPGFTDTNFLNLFFTLLIVLLFFEAIDTNTAKGSINLVLRNNIKNIVCLLLIIPATLLFKFTWSGWFYIFFIMAVFAILYLIYWFIHKIKENKSRKYAVAAVITFLIILGGFYILKDTSFAKDKIERVKAKISPATDTYFPSSAPTTSELLSAEEAQKIKGSSQGPVLYQLNGWILAILAVFSLILLIKNNLKLSQKTKYALFILIWFAIMFYIGYKSIRFISFFALPFSVAVSYGLVVLSNSSKNIVERTYKKHYVETIVVIAILLLIMLPLLSELSERSKRTPAMINIIEKTADRLKNSDEDIIINQWWDKGYFYSYYAERKVLMDNGVGGSTDPRIYWMSRVFMNKDEKEGLQILKMLDCKANVTNPVTNPNQNLSEIKCAVPNSFIILDSGLIGKVEIFNYYSSWNFEEQTHEPFKMPEVSSISAPSNCFNKNSSTMVCAENFEIDTLSLKLIYKDTEFPLAVVGENEIYYSAAKGPYSLLVYPEAYEDGNTLYKAVLLKSELLDTMFVRLYFMKGIGLEHFEPFSDIANPIAGRVVVYKIKW